jgi:hypothetical protein
VAWGRQVTGSDGKIGQPAERMGDAILVAELAAKGEALVVELQGALVLPLGLRNFSQIVQRCCGPPLVSASEDGEGLLLDAGRTFEVALEPVELAEDAQDIGAK